jgi:hypothetical protein
VVLMQFVTLSEKSAKNTIRKHISQVIFWCLWWNWQIMLGCPLGGTLHGVSSPQQRFPSLLVSRCHPRIGLPQHVSILKVAHIWLQATISHFSWSVFILLSLPDWWQPPSPPPVVHPLTRTPVQSLIAAERSHSDLSSAQSLKLNVISFLASSRPKALRADVYTRPGDRLSLNHLPSCEIDLQRFSPSSASLVLSIIPVVAYACKPCRIRLVDTA